MANVEKPSRIFIWAAPRSLSTGLLRAMLNRTCTKVLLEPFANAYYLGPERVSERYKSDKYLENSRYEDIKHQLEQTYEGYSTIVSKDMAYTLGHEKEKMRRYLPTGYGHTFLIRHPAKSMSSFYKMATSPELTGWDHFEPKEAGFKELQYLFEIVTEELGQEAIVIDTDDLLEQPEAVLRLYCDKIGLAYEDSMLHWSAETEDLSVLNDWPAGWFGTLLKTNTFQKLHSHKMPDISSLPDVVKKAVEDSMPHYNVLYEKRFTVN